jgi:hypothetical protein
MTLYDLLNKKRKKYSEISGYYERIPGRIDSFVCVKNEEDEIVYHTTSQEFCNTGPILRLRIIKNDNNRWGIYFKQGEIYWSIICPADLHSEKLSRRRAFWHAGQYMSGKDLSHKKRYSKIYRTNENSENIFEADAFFKNGNAVTTDPFGEFLK